MQGLPECPADPMDRSCKKHEGDMEAVGEVSTMKDQETAYGLWLVMARKRHGNRPTKKEGPTKDTDHMPNLQRILRRR